jgi:hypothetical protein
VLILPNAGFGTPLDFMFCVFWGVGLPITMDRLQSTGPGGVAGSLGFTLPKAAP